MIKYITLLLLCSAAITSPVHAQSNETFTIENYYKAKWGYADEFISLWKKNHYPLLKKAIEKGDIVSVTAEKPRQHAAEESRWDYRVRIVFANTKAAFDPNLTEAYKSTLYTDLDKLKKDEQHRFEILLAHWDVEVTSVDIEKP